MTNTTAAGAWAPDQFAEISLDDALPESFLVKMTTYAGTVEGDAPSVRVPFVGADPTATTVAEGAAFTESDAALDELVIATKKSGVLTSLSNELARQPGANERILKSLQRSLLGKINADYVAALIAASTGFIAGTWDSSTLDAFSDAIADVEANGGEVSHFVMSATAWKSLAKLKAGTGSNLPILGVGDASGDKIQRAVFGVPIELHSGADAIYATSKADLGSAYSPLRVAASQDYKFNEDKMSLRGDVRFGVKAARANRHAKIALPA